MFSKVIYNNYYNYNYLLLKFLTPLFEKNSSVEKLIFSI